MGYMGSKRKLLTWIFKTINDTVDKDLKDCVFCDLFAGSGMVGMKFKKHVKQVIANDLEYYSYVINQHYIGNTYYPFGYRESVIYLNDSFKDGFVTRHYAKDRNYFSVENANIIDGAMEAIESIKGSNSMPLYYALLTSLIEASDKVSNTYGHYKSCHKKLLKNATNRIKIKYEQTGITTQNNQVYNEQANELVKKISGDILYLDPPYNGDVRYGQAYHLLNTIARNDKFVPRGVTGLREYDKSLYCSKVKAKKELSKLIKYSDFKYIFMSYYKHGIITPDEIEIIFKKHGKYSFVTKSHGIYQGKNRKFGEKSTTEYLHILVKD